MTGQISHTTSAQNLPTYFAINHNHAQYFTLDDDDDTTDPRLLHTVDKQIALRDLVTGESCISAMFSNDVGQIHQLCTFTLSKQPLNLNLLLLRNDDVLTTNSSHRSLQCNDTRRPILDCHCSLMLTAHTSARFQSLWPHRVSQCPHSINVTTVKHVVNLATFQFFFSKESIGDLKGDTYLPQPLPVSLPDFHHYQHKFRDSHDLRKFVNRIKNSTLIYEDLSDIILHNSDLWRSDGFDLFTPHPLTPTWWLPWSVFLASYASLAITLYFCYRQKSPGTLLPFFATRTAADYIPPTLAYGNTYPTFSTISGSSLLFSVEMFEGTIVIHLVTVSVLALLVMVLLALWIYHVQSRKNKVYSVLEIGDYTDCVRICCVSLTSVLYAYKFSATNYIENLRTSGFCPGYLSIQWPTFKGTHITRDRFFPFFSKVKIYHWTKPRISKILCNPDLYVIPLVEFYDSFRLLDFSEEHISRERSITVGVTDAHNSSGEHSTPAEQAVSTVKNVE